jgi:acetyl-CoA carboxylase carboxyl transferase subunit beta
MRVGRRGVHREIRAALDTADKERCMSWLEKLLPPKIQHDRPSERRTVPEGLWIKCPSCETVLYNDRSRAEPERLPEVRAPPPHRRARAARCLPRPGRALRDRPGGAAGRRAEVQGQQEVPRALKDALEATGETDALVVIGGA